MTGLMNVKLFYDPPETHEDRGTFWCDLVSEDETVRATGNSETLEGAVKEANKQYHRILKENA